jgi:hypothetical protein
MSWLDESVKKKRASKDPRDIKWTAEHKKQEVYDELTPLVTSLLRDMGEAQWPKKNYGLDGMHSGEYWNWSVSSPYITDRDYWQVRLEFTDLLKASHFVVGGSSRKRTIEDGIATHDVSEPQLKKALKKAFEIGL